MATFRTLPSGKINVQIRIAGTTPRSKTFGNREAAEQWVREQERAITAQQQETIGGLSAEYLREIMVKDGKQRGGYEATAHRLSTLAKKLTMPLEEMTKKDVLDYRSARMQEVSGSTTRLELQLLGRLLRWCKNDKDMEKVSDVTQGVRLPEAGKSRDRVLSEQEVELIVARASDKAKLAIWLAYHTAMRRGEILAITPAMINLNKRIISLPAEVCKNGKARDVSLSLKAVELLTVMIEGKGKHQPLIELSKYGLTQAYRRAAQLANVQGSVFHSLRHTAITNAANKGLSTIQLMAFSGHTDISSLVRYSHVKAESIANLLD